MNWTIEETTNLFNSPFHELMFEAQKIHKINFPDHDIQISTLLSIKTGSCPEDCKYCPQSAHYNTGLKKEALMDLEPILEAAHIAKKNGASRFCMGAAWRSLNDRDLPKIVKIIEEVKKMGLETCMTLGMINENQACSLKEAGLDYYNHNLDSSENFYKKIITTRTYQDRLDTLQNVRNSGIKLCAGGIIGLGESNEDRIELLRTLANMNPQPESVPINMLIKIPGTPLGDAKNVDIFDFVRIIALARILMPKTRVRLSAGRTNFSNEAQTLCFLAGANSIHYGEKLLTAKNSNMNNDMELLNKLGLKAS